MTRKATAIDRFHFATQSICGSQPKSNTPHFSHLDRDLAGVLGYEDDSTGYHLPRKRDGHGEEGVKDHRRLLTDRAHQGGLELAQEERLHH